MDHTVPDRLFEVGRIRLPLDIANLSLFVEPLIKTASGIMVAHRRAAGIDPAFTTEGLVTTDHIGFVSGSHGEFVAIHHGRGQAPVRAPVSYVGPIRTPLGPAHDVGRVYFSGGSAEQFFKALSFVGHQAKCVNRDGGDGAPEPTTENLLFHVDDDGRTFVALYTLPVRHYHR